MKGRFCLNYENDLNLLLGVAKGQVGIAGWYRALPLWGPEVLGPLLLMGWRQRGNPMLELDTTILSVRH